MTPQEATALHNRITRLNPRHYTSPADGLDALRRKYNAEQAYMASKGWAPNRIPDEDSLEHADHEARHVSIKHFGEDRFYRGG